MLWYGICRVKSIILRALDLGFSNTIKRGDVLHALFLIVAAHQGGLVLWYGICRVKPKTTAEGSGARI